MKRFTADEHRLAELFGRYVRAVDGLERQQLGAQLDHLAPLVLNQEKNHAQQPADVVAAEDGP